MEGVTDGVSVGTREGLLFCAAAGFKVGVIVGTLEKLLFWAVVGFKVGVFVGTREGQKLGIAEGLMGPLLPVLGTLREGAKLGAVVGRWLGTGLKPVGGPSVGISVGVSAGSGIYHKHRLGTVVGTVYTLWKVSSAPPKAVAVPSIRYVGPAYSTLPAAVTKAVLNSPETLQLEPSNAMSCNTAEEFAASSSNPFASCTVPFTDRATLAELLVSTVIIPDTDPTRCAR